MTRPGIEPRSPGPLANTNRYANIHIASIYRDDEIIIRKRLHKQFDEFGFKLNLQTDLKITDYLDITLNL